MRLRDYTIEELENEILRREDIAPELIQFEFYLHNDYEISEIQDLIEDQTGYEISYDLARKIAGAFYEVKCDCELNTHTGEFSWK